MVQQTRLSILFILYLWFILFSLGVRTCCPAGPDRRQRQGRLAPGISPQPSLERQWGKKVVFALLSPSSFLRNLWLDSGLRILGFLIYVKGVHIIPMYEKHVLLELNQIYYWIYKCTTCHHYTNVIKTV